MLLMGALLWALGIYHTDRTAILNQPLPDDAYYYFSLARNAAQGRGWVVAAAQVPTTGFQPLWALMLTGLWSASKSLSSDLLISAAQAIALIVGMATALLVFLLLRRLTSRTSIACLGMGAFLFSPQIIRHHLNGMETFLAFLAVASISLVFVLSLGRDLKRWHYAAGGLLGGISILARADMAVWVAAAVAVFVFNRIRNRGCVSLRVSAVNAGMFTAGVLLPLIPWWVYSVGIGQGLVPESGDAVRVLSLLHKHLPLESPFQAIARAPGFYAAYYLRNVTAFTGAWGRQVPLLLPAAVPIYGFLGTRAADSIMTLISLSLAVASLYAARRRESTTLFYLLLFWWTACLALTFAYAILIQGQWFYHRYAASLGFTANLTLLLALVHGFRWIRRHEFRFTAAISMVLAVGFAVLVVEGSYRWLLEGPSAVPDDGFYRASQYISTELPESTRIGAFQGGLIGFYTGQSVVPLDGKVNVQAREALVEKTMFQYLCAEDIGYLVDQQDQIDNLLVRRTEDWEPANMEKIQALQAEGYSGPVIYKINRGRCGP